jgi:hypothetical protein
MPGEYSNVHADASMLSRSSADITGVGAIAERMPQALSVTARLAAVANARKVASGTGVG